MPKKKNKLKVSGIFYIIAGILLLALLASIFGLVPLSMVGVEISKTGINLTIKEIAERNAILIFLTIASAIIGVFLQLRGK